MLYVYMLKNKISKFYIGSTNNLKRRPEEHNQGGSFGHLKRRVRCSIKESGGYIALISVLIISAIIVLIATSASLVSIGESDMGFEENQAWETSFLAAACAEEALQQIKDSLPFSGSGNLSLGQGSCGYTVTRLIGQNRIINASGTVDSIVRKLKITIDKIKPSINITSWQEVADF